MGKITPNAQIYIKKLFENIIELSGDRICSDDSSITCGIAKLESISVTYIGQLRGNDIGSQLKYNFSMTKPSGFRKALRLMTQAEKFDRPIICFVDTIGADPSIFSECMGQLSAVGDNIRFMTQIKVPIISIIIGEAYSGGAMSLCVADRIVMLDNAVLSIISPKSEEIITGNCSNFAKSERVIQLKQMKIIDEVIFCDQNSQAHICDEIKRYIVSELKVLRNMNINELISQRKEKFCFNNYLGD